MISKPSLALMLASLAVAAPAPQNNLGTFPTIFPTATRVSGPGVTGSSSASCITFHTAQAGDSCDSIAAANSLTASTFIQMNPSINPDCTNLLAGTQYCISSSSSASRSLGTALVTKPTSPSISDSRGSKPATSSTSSNISSSSQLPDPNTAQVTNATAFASGAGNKNNANENDGIGAGTDSYTCYKGLSSAYPNSSKWVSFSDMWNANSKFMLQGCSNLSPPVSPDTTEEQLGYIKSGIESVSQASLVDHRFVLATIMQESIGCVNTPATTNGVNNPGLMQSHNGTSFIGSNASAADQAASIQQMIVDGTQGTKFGGGAVQGINMFGNVFDAAHWYNAGFDDSVTDLNAADGATSTYVVDIANRLTGWVAAPKVSCT